MVRRPLVRRPLVRRPLVHRCLVRRPLVQRHLVHRCLVRRRRHRPGPYRLGTRRAGPALAAALLSVSVAACSGSGHHGAPPPDAAGPFTVTTMTSPSGQAEILIRPDVPVTGLVLFEHGYGQTQDALLKVSAFFPLRNALVDQGFAIAASDSHGNNFGDPASVADQTDLLRDAERRLPPVANIDVVGFSMGGLDSLLLASAHSLPGLRSLVLISPACNQVPFLTTQFGPDIRRVFGNKKGTALLDAIDPSNPERKSGSSYAGYRYWFWESPDDTTVKPVQPASMMSILEKAGVPAAFSLLDGNHENLSQLRPGDIARFFAGQPAT